MAFPPEPENSTSDTSLDFLAGGGEMGRLVGSKDWSGTPLGPIEGWPQSLRTTVSLCLASKFPILIAWGPERTQIYNDGYRLICGAERECLASLWPLIGEAFEAAEKGESRLLENQRLFPDRNGYRQETFFTLSFSPIRDERGAIGGVFHTATDTTAAVLSERRTQILRDLAASSAESRTVEDVCSAMSKVLAGCEPDLPFTLLYLRNHAGNGLDLVHSTGLEPGSIAAPVEVRDLEAGWPFHDVLSTGQSQLVENFAARLGIASCGPYPEAPGKALVLPVSGLGIVLVAGVSARLPLDLAYRNFYDLLVAQLASALGKARASEEQKQRERQWRLFDTALSHTPDFTYLFDLDGRFTYVNHALLSLWQKPLEEAVGKNFFELEYPPLLAARLQEQIQHVIRTKAPVRDQTDFTGPTGEVRHYEYIFVPVLDSDGQVEAVAGSTRDITERQQMAVALTASEELLQTVFEQAPVGVAVLRGPQMIFDLVNPSYQNFFPGRRLRNRPLYEAVPEMGAEIRKVLEDVFLTGEPFVGHEFLIPLDLDGDNVIEDCWFTFVYQPLKHADGMVTGVVVVAVNVSTHVMARRALEQANRELEEFSYVASHDLQEPLRMVNIYTELLTKRYPRAEPEVAQFTSIIHQAVKRMENLIRDLLAFSRTIHVEQPLEGVADLAAAVTDATLALMVPIGETDASIMAGALPAVGGETAQMSQVFQNLISNSLKYRNPDRRLEVHISATRNGTHWTVSVRDNGIGFEPQYAERIFGLFKRLHTLEYPGTGLGLAICRRIVERHRGRIWAESVPGDGATFYFTLPAADC